MKRFPIRWYLLNKRLLKKPVFLLILCIVPVLIVALNAVTVHADGFIKIALAAEEPAEPAVMRMTGELLGSTGVVHITACNSAAEAEELVRYGEADGAWILSSDILGRIDRFVSGDKSAACIRIVERQDTISLKLAREKLAAALSSETSFAILRQAYAKNVSPSYDEARLRRCFDSVVDSGELFEFRYTSGELAGNNDASYLMLPIRGILASAILLAGFAMVLFRVRDREQKVFARLDRRTLPLFELGYHLTGIIDVALLVLLSLFLSGNAVSPLREVLSMAVYCLNCASFVILIGLILRKADRIAAASPLILVTVIVVNPILFTLPFVYPLRVITPLYYYLQSAHNTAYIMYGLGYFGIVTAIDLILMLLLEKLNKNT